MSCGGEAPPPPVAARGQADFVNGDFEAGTFTGWTKSTNLDPATGIAVIPPTSIANLGLIAGGVDKTNVKTGPTPESMIPAELTAADSLRYPRFGKSCAVLNELGNTNNSNTIVQQITTTPSDVDAVDGNIHVRFALAPILENPAHLPVQQPYFYIELRNTTTNTVLFSSFNFSGQAGVPFKTAAANAGVQYTDWQLFDVAPGPASIAIGDKLTMQIIATGCSLGGHYGELYMDGFGTFIPGLTVVASAPSAANANSDLTYTFVAKNGGITTADGVVVNDVLPAGTTFVSVSGATCTTPTVGMAGSISCNLGSINPGAASTFQLTVHIDPAATGSVNNGNYTVQGKGVNPLIGPLVQTMITTGVKYTDLAVTVSDGKAALDWGSPTTYTVVVTNNGPTAVTGAKINNALPPQLTGVTWTCAGANGGVCIAGSGNGALVTTADLPVGASVTYTVKGNVIAGTGPGLLNYLVTVATPAGVADATLGNNTGVDTNNIGPIATLTVDKGSSTGTGTVTSSPKAISCGPTCTTQSADFQSGSVITLTAVAAPGSSFTGWGGACAAAGTATQCTVPLAAAQSVSANFSLPSYSVTIKVPGGGGTITCTTPVVQGRDSTCTITPADGYTLDGLTANGTDIFGSVNGTGFTIANVQGDQILTAVFKKNLGTSCGTTGECHSGFCTGGVCCDTACNGVCQGCNIPGQLGICSSACGAYGCNVVQNGCWARCQTSDECAVGGVCSEGQCLAPPTDGSKYALSGGGIGGCSYSGANSAPAGAGLAFLAMLAFVGRRRRAVSRRAA